MAGPLALTVLPRLGLAPRDVRVTARVERDAGNRELCIGFVAEDGTVPVLSCHQLDGLAAPVFYQQLFEHIDAGQYEITLAVRKTDGAVRRVSVSACYAGGDIACAQ